MNEVNKEFVRANASPHADVMQKSGAGTRMNASHFFIKTKLAKLYHSPRAGAKIFVRRIGGELTSFLKPQQSSTSFQAGRSILEMLAVLALIGVLSIAGLMGYRLVMIRYKANETIHDVMLRATNVPMMWNDYASLYDYKYIFPELIPNDVNPVGYAVETWAEPIDSDFTYRVEVKDMPYEVCRHIISMKPTDIALYKAGAELDRTGIDSSQSDCGRNTINMYFFFTGEFSDEAPLCTRENYTQTKECCEAFGSEWFKGACCTPCAECEMRNPSSGVCAYNPSLSKECCEKTSPNYWANDTCCESEEQSEECCLFAAREWSGSTCCAAGQIVVGGECQNPATCSACQDYNASTNTCTDHVKTSACCTAAGRLWSGSTCCTAGQVVVGGECQTPATCSACQDYNSATNTCTDHVRTSACCTAAGRLWSGSTCCTAGQVVVDGECQTPITCSACQDYNASTNTCTDHVRTSACCTAAGRLWSGSTCCTAGQVVVNGQCQDKVTCSACQDYNASTNTCTDHVKTSACCTAAGRLWSGSTCCAAGQIVVGGECQTPATCSACQDYNAATNTCTDHVRTSACCTAAGRLWSGSTCCTAGQVVVNGQCQNPATCSACQDYNAATNTCTDHVRTSACCTAAGRLWSGSTCCAAGQVVVNGQCQDKVTCSACQDYNAATNTCTDHVRTSACCTAASRLWSGSTCCAAGQVVVNGQCQDKVTCSACQDYNSVTNTCTDHVKTSACCTAAGRLWSGSTCCSAGLILIGNNCATCCAAGKGYDKIKHTCTICKAGYYSDACDNLECKKCPLNTYSAAGAKSCTKCPDGTVSEAGSSACTPCPAGTYRNSSSTSVGTNAWECAPCPAGTYSTGGAKSCTKCPEGTVSAKGASACSACPAGTVYSAGKCISCAAGKYAYNGSCVSCQTGTYSAANATSCTSCGSYATSNANKSGCICMYLGTWPNCKSRSGS